MVAPAMSWPWKSVVVLLSVVLFEGMEIVVVFEGVEIVVVFEGVENEESLGDAAASAAASGSSEHSSSWIGSAVEKRKIGNNKNARIGRDSGREETILVIQRSAGKDRRFNSTADDQRI